MREDIHRWQEKYRRAGPIQPLAPDTLLLRHTDLFVAGGIAFDIASGTGHSAVYLAQRGYQVVAFDCSSEGLRRAQQLAAQENTTIQAVALDLDRAQLPLDKANVLTCFRYLNRALFPAMEAAIRSGGLFIYKTFKDIEEQRSRFQSLLKNRGSYSAAFKGYPGGLVLMHYKCESAVYMFVCTDGPTKEGYCE